MIFHRAFNLATKVDGDLTVLGTECTAFLQACTRVVTSIGKAATLFGDGATALVVIERGLQQVDRLLSGFRVAPGIGKAIQKILDQTLDVMRRAIPALRLALGRVSRTVSVLNVSAVPAVRDAMKNNVEPLVQPVRSINDSLLLILPRLKEQQRWIELLTPPAYLQRIESTVIALESLDRQMASRTAELKQLTLALVALRSFLDTLYVSLSFKKATIDNIKAFLEELGESIKGLIQGIGDVLPGWVLTGVKAIVDFIDSAIDWVLQRLGDLLDWVGIDFRGFLRWIEDAKNRLGRELAELLGFVDAISALIQPLQIWAQYLQTTVMGVLRDATQTVRDFHAKGQELLMLLQGLRIIKLILEIFLPRWLRQLRLAAVRVSRDGKAGVPQLRRELERIDVKWAEAPMAIVGGGLMGAWLGVLERAQTLAASAPKVSNDTLKRRAAALTEEVRAVEARWRKDVERQVARLPKGSLEALAAMPMVSSGPYRLIAQSDTSGATDQTRLSDRIRNVGIRVPAMRVRPTAETQALRADLKLALQRRTRSRLTPHQQRVDAQLEVLRTRFGR